MLLSDSPGLIIGKESPVVYVPGGLGPEQEAAYFGDVIRAVYFTSKYASEMKCTECLVGVYRYWGGGRKRTRSIGDRAGNMTRLGEYRRSFSTEHNRWRRKFMGASGRCASCGSAENLELAHITGVEDFFYRYGKKRTLRYPFLKYKGVETSYRRDNLILLCSECHDAQTLGWSLWYALERPKEFLELMHRRHRVLGIFEGIIEKRGWRTAEDLFQAKLF